MFRKSFVLILTILTIFSLFSIVRAFDENQITKLQCQVNSKEIRLFDINNEEKKVEINYPVFIKNNRSVIETFFFTGIWQFGLTTYIEYEPVTKGVRYIFRDKEDNTLQIYIDTIKNQCQAFYNNNELKIDDKPFQPVIKDKTTLKTYYVLPIRFVFETFGYTVEWKNETQEVIVYK